jgi:hypothetical protein
LTGGILAACQQQAGFHYDNLCTGSDMFRRHSAPMPHCATRNIAVSAADKWMAQTGKLQGGNRVKFRLVKKFVTKMTFLLGKMAIPTFTL